MHGNSEDANKAINTFSKYQCTQFIFEGLLYREKPYSRSETLNMFSRGSHKEFGEALASSLPDGAVIYGCEDANPPNIYEERGGIQCVKFDNYKRSLLEAVKHANNLSKELLGEREGVFVSNISRHLNIMNNDPLYIGFGLRHVRLEFNLRRLFEGRGDFIVEPINEVLYRNFTEQENRVSTVKSGAVLTASLLQQRWLLGENFREAVPLNEIMVAFQSSGLTLGEFVASIDEKARELSKLPDSDIVSIWNENKLR